MGTVIPVTEICFEQGGHRPTPLTKKILLGLSQTASATSFKVEGQIFRIAGLITQRSQSI